jgi:hypothetical protein
MFLPSLGLHFVAEKCKNFHLLSYDDNFLEQYHLLFWLVNCSAGEFLDAVHWLCGWLSLFTFLVLQQPKKQYWLALVQQAVKMYR